MRALLNRLCRRLHAAMLRTRIAQLRLAVSQLPGRTPDEAVQRHRVEVAILVAYADLAALERRP